MGWENIELYPDPPEGKLHRLDLIAEVEFRPPPEQMKSEEPPESKPILILVHIEIESPDHTTVLKPRFPYYFHFFHDKLGKPGFSIAAFLKVGLDGIEMGVYIERLWDLEINKFQYLYVGLPALNAVEYRDRDNWLGMVLSALMNIPEEDIIRFKAETLERLAGAPLSEQLRLLLGECFHPYIPLRQPQWDEFETFIEEHPRIPRSQESA